MRRISGVFAGSIIAVMVVGAARADVAAVAYVNTQVATKADKSDVYTKQAVDDMLTDKQAALTDAQVQAADSGITKEKVTKYDGYAAQIAAKVSANNPKVTINQGDVEKGSFTLNQDGSATINLTDNDTKYTAGANIEISENNVISATGTTYTASGSNGVSASVNGTVVNVAGTAASKTAAGVVKVGDNINVTEDGTISVAAPVTPGNGTVTVKQGGVEKATFTLNQTGNTTVELTDENTTYTLPVAGTALGGVKSGNDITVADTGVVTVTHAGSADTATSAANATKATQDSDGNTINTTYQKAATAVTHTASTAVGDGTHPVYIASTGVATKIDKVAAASTADTATTATNAKKICNGSSCASYVDIWVE